MTATCAVPHPRPATDDDPVDSLREHGGSLVVYDRVQPAMFDGAHLCAGHLARLCELVALTPHIVAFLLSEREKSHAAKDDETARRKTDPPAPLSLAAFDAANEEVWLLYSWAGYYSDTTGLKAPAMVDLWRTRGEILGARRNHVRICDALTRFLLADHDRLATCSWAGDYLHEITRARTPRPERWQLVDRIKTSDYLCMGCERRNVDMCPPVAYGAPYLLQCPKCGWTAEREEFDRIAAVLEQAEHERDRVESDV